MLNVFLAVIITSFTTLTTVLVTTVDDVNPFMVLANYGVLGIFTFLFVTKKIHTQSTVDVLHDQIMSLERIISAFQSATTNQTLPALARSTEVLDALPNEGESIRELNALITRLEELAGPEKKGRR